MQSSSSPLALLAAGTQADSSPFPRVSEHFLSSALGPQQVSSSALSRPRPGCLQQGLSLPATHSTEPGELKAGQQAANTLQM